MPRKKTTGSRRIGGRHGATCGELLALLNEYVDGNVDPAICKELEGHLAGCNPCRVVVDNVRKTITLYRKEKPCNLPAAFQDRLHALLRSRWVQQGRGQKAEVRGQRTEKSAKAGVVAQRRIARKRAVCIPANTSAG